MVTPISEIIFSGFVSKAVNNCVDVSWIKIKSVVKGKKTEHQTLESQIYNIIVNVLNQMTNNEFENAQDKVYQAAEELLLGYEKVKNDDIEIVRSGLQVLGKNVNNDIYREFKGKIYYEIGKKENVELYHTILLWLLDQKKKYDQFEIEQLNQKLDAVLQILESKETEANSQHNDIKRGIKSRTQEYADKWEKNKIGKHEKLLYDLQTICIGCNKKWMDSVFGIPVFTNTDRVTNEEVYITDIALIRAYFKIDSNSCVMFFITQTTEKAIPFMPTLRNIYFNTMGEAKELGTLSYDEIKNSGYKLFIAYGFFTNGSGRTFYGEGYDPFFSYYYPTYYASVDYGVNNPWNMIGYIDNPDFIENEISLYENLDMDNRINRYKKFLSHRKDHYPNTYGVSSLNSDYTFDKLMDYNTFDSMQTAYR